MQEIERKFLVNNLQFKEEATSFFEIAQGFLIKGKSNESGTSRFEWEKEIAITEAKQLLQLCEKGIIQKTRYNIPSGNHIFEVDEFFGENEGLIVAEVELQHENEAFKKPTWLGEEVTGQIPYYNSQLSKKPYKTWNHE
jgi:adenylate cyclase